MPEGLLNSPNHNMLPSSLSCTSGVYPVQGIKLPDLSSLPAPVSRNHNYVLNRDPDFIKSLDSNTTLNEYERYIDIEERARKLKKDKGGYEKDKGSKYIAYRDGTRVYGDKGQFLKEVEEELPPCVLYAFDGTDNDMFTSDWDEHSDGGGITNVEIMFRMYEGRKRYAAGVGTNEKEKKQSLKKRWKKAKYTPAKVVYNERERIIGNIADKPVGLMFGGGIEARFKEMMKFFKKDYALNPKIRIHIIGFSRGAAAAREFANRVGVEVEFLGVFDTVAQEGAPDHSNINKSLELRLSDKVKFAYHAIAKNEYRELFPMTSLTNNYYPNAYKEVAIPENYTAGYRSPASITYKRVKKKQTQFKPGDYKEGKGHNFREVPYTGAHSDIGGGYKDYRNMKCFKDMWQKALDNKMPLRPWQDYAYDEKAKGYEFKKLLRDIPEKLIGSGKDRNYYGRREEHIETEGHDSREGAAWIIHDKILHPHQKSRNIFSVEAAPKKNR